MRRLELPKGKIGPNFTRKVLPWVETFWHNHKRYPSDTDLSAQFGFSALDLQRLHASKFYMNCLKDRGISKEANYFSEKQVAAISLITNIFDPRPVNAKLSAIGVTPEEYHGWMSNPSFKNELTNRAEEIMDNVFPEAQAALAKQVKNGNIPALKFYYEITGRAQSQETINVKIMMMKVIEAVQKHVKDPEVLAAIASDIQAAKQLSVATPELPATAPPKNLKQAYAAHVEERTM